MARDAHPMAPRGDASEHSVGGCGIAPEAAAASAQPARPKPRREKKNKYAQFSKADDVRKSLRFS